MILHEIPIVKKSRINSPRRRRLTAQEWDSLFTRDAACLAGQQWAHFAALTGCRIATVKAWFSRLYPSGHKRQEADVTVYPLRKTDWTQDEIDTLVELVDQGYAPEDIAATMHRTVGACHAKYLQVEMADNPIPADATVVPRWNAAYVLHCKQEQATRSKQRDLDTVYKMDMAGRSPAGIAQATNRTVTDVELILKEQRRRNAI